MSKRTVMVTGANGFVGAALVRTMQHSPEIAVRRAYRQAPMPGPDQVDIGSIGPDTDWSEALKDVHAVVHCAARVHIMRDAGSAESLASFRKVNVEGSANLARQAAKAGVKRLVFVSSIKVNGETTIGLPPFAYDSPPAPQDAYGLSKWEAEQELWRISRDTGLEVVVVRPPLIYGPGVKANFQRLMQAVERGIPLPFGLVNNRRSMVYVENLTDLLTRCVLDSRATGTTFLVSDGKDLSTRDLVNQMAKVCGSRFSQFPLPPSFIRMVARLAKKQDFADRLLGSLQVDIAHTCKKIDWKPPFTPEEGIRATLAAHKANNARL